MKIELSFAALHVCRIDRHSSGSFTLTHVSGPDKSRLGVAQPYQLNGHPHALASSGDHVPAGVSLGHELRALALSHTTPVQRGNA